MYAIGADIGGTSTEVGVVGDVGEIVLRCCMLPPTHDQPVCVAEEYAQATACLLARCQEADFQEKEARE